MAAIEFSAVEKNFGEVSVLKGVNLAIRSGEFVVLVGPSGCGKSTLLRLLAGLEAVSAGEIRIDGDVVNDRPPKDRDIAMVFQSYALYPHMNVRDNMSYSLRLKRTARERIADLVQAAGAKLGLEALVERKPRQLSGGQRQRVAMGRAIVRKPKAFLFDEPLSNLDARLREQMRFEIRKLHHDLGATSVYVTHDQIEAMTMADRIVALNGGHIQQVGTPLELYDDPANVFVAGFIGSPAMNFVPVSASAEGDKVALSVSGQTWLWAAKPKGLPSDGRITLGVRPERIKLVSRGDGSISAKAVMVETTGLGTIVHAEADGHLLKAFTTERPQIGADQPIALSIEAKDAFMFDPASGNRLRA